jgi:hypothetical protein
VLSEYQQQLRARYLSAPLVGAPEPWRGIGGPPSYVLVGGLQDVGFGVHPDTGADHLMVVSIDGFGLIDAASGVKLARDREPAPEVSIPSAPRCAARRNRPSVTVTCSARRA